MRANESTLGSRGFAIRGATVGLSVRASSKTRPDMPTEVPEWVRWLLVLAVGLLLGIPHMAAAKDATRMSCVEQRWGCFSMGSYGRVQPAWNLRGGTGRPANLVSHGTRIELPPYAEIDFYYRKSIRRQGNGEGGEDEGRPPIRAGAVVTLGFLEDLFHFTGDFDQSFALRNLYGWADGLAGGRLMIWAGSRMYRGDDIYLFDYWPLDNLNTYGGGAELRLDPARIALHVGTNRLKDDFQFQEVDVQSDTPEPETVVYLDRQRTIVSLKATVEGHPGGGKVGVKGKLYGEFHGLPSVLLLYEDGSRQEVLPSDAGWVVGGQVGVWGFGHNGFANLFIRGAGGLGAYGEWAVPFGLDTEKKTTRAREFLTGVSANVESRHLGVMFGAYARYFRDADPNVYDLDDKWEFIVAARPHVFVGRYFQPFMELSYQKQVPNGLSPETLTRDPAGIFKLAIGPSVAFKRGSYARPRFHAVYNLSVLDGNARRLYDDLDPRREQKVQHYLGIGVEWWINSSSY